MKLGLALILSISLVGTSVAMACINSMRVDGDDAVKQIAYAQHLLAKGQIAKAERLVDPREYHFGDPGLQKKAHVIAHTAAVRSGKVATYRIEAATSFFRAQLQENPEDPLSIARHAEALALATKTADKARAALEDLVERDLMPEAQSYAALARLYSKAGEKAAANRAVASCLKMTKHKTVCALKLKTRKKELKRARRARG